MWPACWPPNIQTMWMKPPMCFSVVPNVCSVPGCSVSSIALLRCIWRPLHHLQTLVGLSCPCTALPSKIHPSAKEPVGANNDSSLSFDLLCLLSVSLSCLAHNSYCTTLRMWECLHIERHIDIHSVLLQVTIGNTDDGTEHPSPPPFEHQSD